MKIWSIFLIAGIALSGTGARGAYAEKEEALALGYQTALGLCMAREVKHVLSRSTYRELRVETLTRRNGSASANFTATMNGETYTGSLRVDWSRPWYYKLRGNPGDFLNPALDLPVGARTYDEDVVTCTLHPEQVHFRQYAFELLAADGRRVFWVQGLYDPQYFR